MTAVDAIGASTSSIQQILERVIHETGVPGISAAVSVAGETRMAHAGVAALETGVEFSTGSRFEVSCLMKFFVSLLVHEQIGRGVLRLDATIGDYLAELANSEVGARVRIEHLLSHTSGYRGFDITDARVKWGCSWQVLVEGLKSRPLSFPPGWAFNYEHTEHVILGEILTRLTGRSVHDQVRDRLFLPLGIHASRAADDKNSGSAYVGQHIYTPQGRYLPSSLPPIGSFWASSLPDMTLTLSDLARLGEWLLSDIAWKPALVALEQSVTTIVRQVSSSTMSELIPVSFGYLGGQYGGQLTGHNGSVVGQTVALRFDVGRQMVLVAGVNAWAPYARDLTIKRLKAAFSNCSLGPVGHPGDRTSFPLHALVSDIPLQQLVGTYAGSFRSQVSVEQEEGVIRAFAGVGRQKQSIFTARPAPGGGYVLDAASPLSCAFGLHPEDDTPVAFLGVHAYRKT